MIKQLVEEYLFLDSLSAAHKEAVLSYVTAAYTNTDRGYHGIEHISTMLGWVEDYYEENHNCTKVGTVMGDISTRDKLVLSILFHDSVFVPYSALNEDESARLANLFLKGLGCTSADCKVIARAIAYTDYKSYPKLHIPLLAHMTEVRWLIIALRELDFASAFGVPWQVYLWNIAGNLKESQRLATEFIPARISFLKTVNLDNLFLTPYAKTKWLNIGNTNIERELKFYESMTILEHPECWGATIEQIKECLPKKTTQ